MVKRRKIQDSAALPQPTTAPTVTNISKRRKTVPPASKAGKTLEAPKGFSGDGKGERTAFLDVKRMSLFDLDDHPRNEEVRKHPEPGTPRWDTLKKSLEHDYFDPMVWNVRNGQLVSGHLRKKVMLQEGLYTHAMVVVVDYDEPTHLARLLAANKGMGTTDLQGQATFLAELKNIGDGFEVNLSGFSLEEASVLVDDPYVDTEKGIYGGGEDDEGEDDEDLGDDGLDAYSTKISAPTYTPKEEVQPSLGVLMDTTKRDSLVKEINSAKIPDDVKEFLRAAACRHTVFDYGQVAEYYSHAPKRIQELFENSALVIIDFDKAIENGYVRLTDRMKDLYGKNIERLDSVRSGGLEDAEA